MDVQFRKCLMFVALMERVSLNSPIPIPLQTAETRQALIPFTCAASRTAGSVSGSRENHPCQTDRWSFTQQTLLGEVGKGAAAGEQLFLHKESRNGTI